MHSVMLKDGHGLKIEKTLLTTHVNLNTGILQDVNPFKVHNLLLLCIISYHKSPGIHWVKCNSVG